MILSEIIDERARYLEYDVDDKYGSSPTTQQKVDSVNMAIRTMSKRIFQYDPMITFTLTAEQASYNIRDTAVVQRKIIRPYSVIINGNPLYNAANQEWGVWSLAELERIAPKWRTDTSGTPSKAVYYGNNKLVLHPKPTAQVVSDGNNYISGQYLAKNMTTSELAGEPDIPEELHEALAYLAAYYSALSHTSEEEGWHRLAQYNQEWQQFAEEVRRENMRAIQAVGSTSAADTRHFIWM